MLEQNIWNTLSSWNWITVLLAATWILSVVQGLLRGASSSARHLMLLVSEGIATVLGILLAWKLASWLSPQIQAWLTAQRVQIPAETLGLGQQIYYTLVTSLRDFSLLRFGLVFVVGYAVIKQLIYRLIDPLVDIWMAKSMSRGARVERRGAPTVFSSLIGGVIGALTGAGRGLMLVAALFVVTTLFPQTEAAKYIQASELYQKGANGVIRPVTGDFLASQLPVFTRAVENEFSQILQRKYEVLDANIPNDISAAAKEVTAKGQTDEEKAKLLYKWVGTRVTYDWDKVNLYEQKRIWKEQTPEETFATKKGVCIDYSRLYAVMARSVGLQVKVVTGLGYDGRGGYGPHAWNEVYLSDKGTWVPLDSTWVASGGNWFNPPNFNETHIREA